MITPATASSQRAARSLYSVFLSRDRQGADASAFRIFRILDAAHH